jgi:hypothetical protein
MEYLEWLRNGSEFHKITPQSDGFTISIAIDSEEGCERFHQIVDDAVGRAASEGYEILPHRGSMNSDRWDFAAITVR